MIRAATFALFGSALAACVPGLPGAALQKDIDAGTPGAGTGGTSGAAGQPIGAAGQAGQGTGGTAGQATGAGGGGAHPPTPSPFTFVTNAGLPANIAVDETSLYWANHQTNTVLRLAIDAASPPVALAPFGPGSGHWVTIDAQTVYYANSGSFGPEILSVSKNGGTIVHVADSPGPIDQIASRGGIFWTTFDGSVMKVDAPGRARTQLASAQAGISALAVDASSVYWVNGDLTLMKVSVGGGSPIPLAAWPPEPGSMVVPKPIASVAVDGTYAYWGRLDGPIMKVPLDGGAPVVAFRNGNSRRAACVTADDIGVYYGDVLGAAHIFKSAFPDAEWMTGNGGGPATAIATDATSVYWIVAPPVDAILKAPK